MDVLYPPRNATCAELLETVFGGPFPPFPTFDRSTVLSDPAYAGILCRVSVPL